MVRLNAHLAQHHRNRQKVSVDAKHARSRHLFVTQDYPPDLGGMARRHVELCRRFSDDTIAMEVSTVRSDGAAAFDASESYKINRQPFYFSEAKIFTNQLRWARWLLAPAQRDVRVLHCGNIRPVGYAVALAHFRRSTPFLVYVNGSDVLREQMSLGQIRKRVGARRILGAASGIVATSKWVADITGQLVDALEIRNAPPIGAFDLGTDPDFFHPRNDTRRLRASWRVGDAPLLLTVARLIPHKGQDVVMRAVAALKDDFPGLHYAIVGVGPDEQRLRGLAAELNIEDRIIFTGALSDEQIAEAYATATIYLGLSRVEEVIFAEGFGISFLEAAASGLPSIAGDSGGVRSAVRDNVSGIIVPPTDVNAVVDAIRALLDKPEKRQAMGAAARRLVETYYNWDRVTKDTREFTRRVVAR
jgi:phosphatidylinositol alpha-1,6-mannosyltransferase